MDPFFGFLPFFHALFFFGGIFRADTRQLIAFPLSQYPLAHVT
jgi:hypothetical protein